MRAVIKLVGVSIVLLLSAGATAQQTVYKWVDADGVVHFSDEPPDESQGLVAEELTITGSTAQPDSAQAAVPTPSPGARESVGQATPAVSQPQSNRPSEDFAALSVEELDRRCEAEREARIAPLRQAEIEKCINEDGKDPAYCNRFFADYGASGRTVTGGVRPRMFNDLPVCLEAERKRREDRR